MITALNVPNYDWTWALDQLPLIADALVAIDRGKTAETGADAAINFRA
jgi:hypothetical protein